MLTYSLPQIRVFAAAVARAETRRMANWLPVLATAAQGGHKEIVKLGRALEKS